MRWPFASSALLLLCAGAAEAAVTASLDSNQVALGETVQLILEHDGQTTDAPDLRPLMQDFDVLANNRSSNVQIINGSVASHVQAQLTLSPKHAGRLTVPSIAWAGERSNPLLLIVAATTAGPSSPANGAPPGNRVFVETTIEPKDPFVQAAVKATVRVYTAEQLYQAGLDLPASGDVLVQQIGADQNRTLDKNGQQYQVYERHYLLFPQRSGHLSLPGAVLAAQVRTRLRLSPFGSDPFSDFFGSSGVFGNARPIRVHGEAIELEVRPRPVDVNSSYWLPARRVSLTGQWRPDPLEAHVGDPVTLELHLRAEGLTAAQLPDLSSMLSLPAGLKAYPDQAKLNNAPQGDTIVGTRDQNVALIADQAGQYSLPALKVVWWDTQANEAREESLPARSLNILPAAGGSSTSSAPSLAEPAPAAQPPLAAAASGPFAPARPDRNPWPWISLGLGCLWLATLLAWWTTRRRRSRQPTSVGAVELTGTAREEASRARNLFRAACQRDDAPSARRYLLAWAAAWADTPWAGEQPGLRAVAARLGNEKLTALLSDLDRACFAGVAWRGAALGAALRDLPMPPRGARASANPLAPLYH